MHEGLEIHPWSQPDLLPLMLSVVFFSGMWLLHVGFPREARRLGWAWSKPRNLTTRNASESPQTMGVLLSHVLALCGFLAGLGSVFPSDSGISPGEVAAWILGISCLRWGGSRVAFGLGDLSSTLVEMSRHNHTWMGLVLAAWALVASLNPFVRSWPYAAWCGIGVFALSALAGAWRTSQLIQGSQKHRVVGIVYLCTLEWGWALFWVQWSLRAAIR